MRKFIYVLAMLSLAGCTPEPEDKARARMAIDLCNDEVKDDLKPADQRLFIRNTCDRMRADFNLKYSEHLSR